jgi:aspartate/methionine/tyrosine aminotransferase
MRCILDPGDEAVVITPAWPNGVGIAGLFSARAVEIPYLLRGQKYELDFTTLEMAIGRDTRMILYTSPSNPLGWVASTEDQDRLLDLCRRHGIWLVADEVYERLYYEGPVAPSILRRSSPEDPVVVIQSFSKSYCMTGWRLGWLVSTPDLARKAAQLNEYVVSNAPTMFQKAGEEALREGEAEISAMVARLCRNRDLMRSALAAAPGVTVPEPQGAFYLFPRIEGMKDSFEFCRQLLIREKVGIAPGVAFGAGGEGSIRICYAADRAVLEPAAERLVQFIRRGGIGGP